MPPGRHSPRSEGARVSMIFPGDILDPGSLITRSLADTRLSQADQTQFRKVKTTERSQSISQNAKSANDADT